MPYQSPTGSYPAFTLEKTCSRKYQLPATATLPYSTKFSNTHADDPNIPNESQYRSPSFNSHEGELVENFIRQELQNSVIESDYSLQEFASPPDTLP